MVCFASRPAARRGPAAGSHRAEEQVQAPSAQADAPAPARGVEDPQGPQRADLRPGGPPAPAAGDAQSPEKTSGDQGGATDAASKVEAVLQELQGIEVDGSRVSVRRAVEAIRTHLPGIDFLSVLVCAPDSNVCIVGAAVGEGSQLLTGSNIITCGRGSAVALCTRQPPVRQSVYRDVAACGAGGLPPDWQQLHEGAGLQSFLGLSIEEPGGAVVGVMQVASLLPGTFQEPGWDSMLRALLPSLGPLLGHRLLSGLRRMAAQLQEPGFPDHTTLITLLLRESEALLRSATNLPITPRLGLISPDGGRLHVFYRTSRDTLQVVRLPAANSLLQSAVRAGNTRVISDMGDYTAALSSDPEPDLFIAGGQPIASLAVVPFGPCKGGLYVYCSTPGDFQAAKREILSLVAMLQAQLSPHLEAGGLLARVWDEPQLAAQSASRGRVSTPDAATSTRLPQQRHPLSQAIAAAGGTSSMVQLLQEQVRRSVEAANKGLNMELDGATGHAYVEDLKLSRFLGKGGFGSVYLGTWKGSAVAIKVMTVPKEHRQLVKAAMEMAVQDSLSHPNIVRVFATLTDMVEETVPDDGGRLVAGASMHNLAAVRYRPLCERDPESTMLCNLIIMEHCNLGSLHGVVRRSYFSCEGEDGALVVNMSRMLYVLIDVARSLQHMHGLGFIHCDLKPANVLLKSDVDSALKFVCKIGDFGLVKVLGDSMYIKNASLSGTMTHVAPERYVAGSRLTPAADMYAFGMIMYELYTGHGPFPKLMAASFVARVAAGGRPPFPEGAPQEYRELAEACWSQDAADRPSADIVVKRLQAMLASELSASELSASELSAGATFAQ